MAGDLSVRRLIALGSVATLVAAVAHAHPVAETAAELPPESVAELWRRWPLEPGVIVPLALAAVLYGRGVARRGEGRAPLRPGEIAAFAAGWLALVIALASPLHPLGEALFSAHMAQHELLMLVAAPLCVLGRPHVAMLRALPARWLRPVAAHPAARGLRRLAETTSSPLLAWSVHAATLWVWHVPPLFDAAVRSDAIHAVQHATFFGSALLFWWALLERGARRPAHYGAAILYLFTTALHSGMLGVLLTFSDAPWYPAYAHTTTPWGLTPLADQQLGGVIMWAPACAFYTVGGLALFVAWLRASAEHARRAEARWVAEIGGQS